MTTFSDIIQWVTVTEANTYFATYRMGASTYWDVSGVDKAAALFTAQRMLDTCGEFDFPIVSVAVPATLEMKIAVCEQALFIVRNTDWEDRLALQAQGVVAAGIVKETWAGGGAEIPIAPLARQALATMGYAVSGSAFIPWER